MFPSPERSACGLPSAHTAPRRPWFSHQAFAVGVRREDHTDTSCGTGLPSHQGGAPQSLASILLDRCVNRPEGEKVM